MAGGRDNEKMKLVSSFVTREFKLKLQKLAKERGVTVSDIIREKLKEELGEERDISSQKGSE
tara:strand:+ start:7292 stop:7477 length:186 start_codon:yes stop_codon:yes gene_type:complete